MGTCWPGERSDRSNSPTPLPKKEEERMANIHIDGNNPLFRSYILLERNMVEKRVYDWRSIPITNQFHCRGNVCFEVRNKGIKDNNFVVGVIRRSAITTQMAMPWRTHHCICYESHQKAGESGLIFQGKVSKVGSGIGEGETIKVIMGQEEIQFKSNKKTLAYMKLPVDFLSDEILPYVALFHQGDKIQFLHLVIVV